MAEQLIIHVKIDGFSPQKETGKGGGSATTAAVAAGAIGASLQGKNEYLIRKSSPQHKKVGYDIGPLCIG